MGRHESKPTIRILMLGAPGVGKNCLESRFTTTTYPPLYDPALTLNSRRYFTLSPRPSSPPEPTTRPLDTSYGLPKLRQTSFEDELLTTGERVGDEEDNRPRTASSTFSNPASLSRRSNGHTAAKAAGPSKTPSENPPAAVASDHEQHQPCAECQREARTYLVELTNHPALRLDNVRATVLAKGEYDAVLLIYDVGSRASFDAVPGLAAEVPLYSRGRKKMLRRGSVSEGLDGMAGDESGRAEAGAGWKQGRIKLKRRRSSVVVGMNDGAYNRASSSMSFGSSRGPGHGSGGPVVVLVGNKADFDADCASVDLGFEAKRAALEEVDVEERGLMHPLYRQSQLYRASVDVKDGMGVAIGLPELRSMIAAKPRLLKSDTTASSVRPLLSRYSGRSFASEVPVQEERRPGATGNVAESEEWPLTGKISEIEDIKLKKQDTENVLAKFNLNAATATASRIHNRSANLDSIVRRSAMSADYHSPNNRTSILSKRSVRTMQEGSKPLVLTKLPKSEAIENWIRTGSPTTAEHPDNESHDLKDSGVRQTANEGNEYHSRNHASSEGRDRSYSNTTTTAASRRQVSRLEGEILARTLMLNVPFYETSAKTGENVEEMFEAVLREVLGGRDALPDEGALLVECRRKHGTKIGRKTMEETRRKRGKDCAGITSPKTSGGNNEKPAIDAETRDMAIDISEDGPAPPQVGHRRRRASMLDRFRKVFTRKSAVMVDDVAS
ncbi:hypothetical protein BR93DRAFT_965315 [Coniochaeta sp. PMI_546]|nr:hypothetical protein BR93DRAFT_965315 [Coniochaeta sp. PMI_546]